MVSKNSYKGIDTYTAALIKSKAHQLIGKAGFTDNDRRDLEQELMLDLLRRMKHFDPTKAKLNTFMSRVVEHRVITLIEEQLYKCRDYRCRGMSLNKAITDSDETLGELIDALTYDGFKSHRESSTSEGRTHDFEIDLARATKALQPELRDLFERLRTSTMTEIARDLGVRRTTLYERLKVIRKRLKDSGIDDHI